MNKKLETLKHNNVLNLIWLICLIVSISIAIPSIIIMILAVFDVKILSWTIGYIITSGTNSTVKTPSIILSLVSTIIVICCLLKNKFLKLWIKLYPENISLQKH